MTLRKTIFTAALFTAASALVGCAYGDANESEQVGDAQEAVGPGPEPDPALARQLAVWSGASDPAVALHAVTAWSRLHGFVSLEIEGNFRGEGAEAAA